MNNDDYHFSMKVLLIEIPHCEISKNCSADNFFLCGKILMDLLEKKGANSAINIINVRSLSYYDGHQQMVLYIKIDDIIYRVEIFYAVAKDVYESLLIPLSLDATAIVYLVSEIEETDIHNVLSYINRVEKDPLRTPLNLMTDIQTAPLKMIGVINSNPLTEKFVATTYNECMMNHTGVVYFSSPLWINTLDSPAPAKQPHCATIDEFLVQLIQKCIGEAVDTTTGVDGSVLYGKRILAGKLSQFKLSK